MCNAPNGGTSKLCSTAAADTAENGLCQCDGWFFVFFYVFSTLGAQFATPSPVKSAHRTKIAVAFYMGVKQTPANVHVHVRQGHLIFGF